MKIQVVIMVLMVGLLAGMAQADLMLHYQFEEGTGTTASSSINQSTGSDLALRQGTGGTIGWGTGKIGGGVVVAHTSNATNVDAYAADAATWTPSGTEVSVALWYNETALGNWAPSLAGSNLLYNVGINESYDHKPFFSVHGVHQQTVMSPDPIVLNEWTHIAGTYDGTTARLYVNGVEVASAPVTSVAWATATKAGIGHFPNSKWTLLGTYDDIRVYDHALTAIEVVDLLQEMGPRLISPLAADSPTGYDLTLKWAAGGGFPNPSGYDVYLDPNAVNVGTKHPLAKQNIMLLVDPCLPVTGLAHGETYYWMAVAKQITPPEDTNSFPSSVASFWTLPDEPSITLDPVSQTVLDSVIFTVEASNATGYQWYFAPTPYTSGTKVTGETGPNLSLTGLVQGQEGYYYCIVSNASVYTDTSKKARLMLQRLVAQWDFEDVIDASVGGFTGEYFDPNVPTDPNFSAAIPVYNNDVPSPMGGKALQLGGRTMGVSGEGVIVSDPNFFNFYPQGVTASAWVNIQGGGARWGGLVTKQQRATQPFVGWGLTENAANQGTFTTRGSAGDTKGTSVGGINEDLDNGWHLVTGTYDGENTRIYIDGDLKLTKTSANTMGETVEPVVIGMERADGLSPLDGLIDGVQIYSYALSRTEVAVMYTNLVPGAEICVADMVDDDFDFNDDCIVDLKDFAEFAEAWLESSIVK